MIDHDGNTSRTCSVLGAFLGASWAGEMERARPGEGRISRACGCVPRRRVLGFISHDSRAGLYYSRKKDYSSIVCERFTS